MTQQQLKDLITNSLGAVVDEAIRNAGPHPSVTTYPTDAATIASWSHQQRLRYYIDRARHNGDLPAARTAGDELWPDSDWASIVAA